jgi:hypothetical protein
MNFHEQNAECLLLFPVPLPRPGFYSQSLAQFTSCVPAAACPGVDAVLVAAQYRSLLAGGPASAPQLEAMLQQFFLVADANATRNASVGGCEPAPYHPRVCTRYRCACYLSRWFMCCAAGGGRRQRDSGLGGVATRASGIPQRVHHGLRTG